VSFSRQSASQLSAFPFHWLRLSAYEVSHLSDGFLHRTLHQLISSGKHS
jgi:hypothetical protein